MADVKLYGTRYSYFAYRVIWALKLKGVGFEYIEEDLRRKSADLLRYNPVHKKIPILLHKEQPICESMVIVDYINETWPANPLLPVDLLAKAKARFWVKYFDDKSPAVVKQLWATGEELENARKETNQTLQTIEEHLIGDSKFFRGDNIGYVDIAFAGVACYLGILNEASESEILLESGRFPRSHAWLMNILEHPVIKDNLPDRSELVAFFKMVRQTGPAYAQ